MYIQDEWPLGPDGEPYNGLHLLDLVRKGESPFRDVWDVNSLVQEVERELCTVINDITAVTKGSNNYVSQHFRA